MVIIFTLIAIKWVVSYQTECFNLVQGALKIKNNYPNAVAHPRTRQVHNDLRTADHKGNALTS